MTNELDSGTDDDSCDDKPAMIKFNEDETLRKDSYLRWEWNFHL